MEYDLELDRAVMIVQQSGAKKVCVQLPDGLKPKAQQIVDTLASSTSAEIFIWAGSCFGACDTPNITESMGFDLVIQWGHSPWNKQS